MRARTNFMIDAAIMAGYAVATNPMTTGTPVHEWLGIGVALTGFVHLVLHWEWATGAVRRFFGKLNAISRVNLSVDLGLLVAGVATAMSGLLVSHSALRLIGYSVSETSIWHRVHAESSTVLLALVGLHVGLHWDWVGSVFRNQVVKPLLASRGARAVGAGATPARVRAQAPQLRSTLPRTAAALALVGLTAWSVWMAAPRAEAGLAWLVLPGESEVIERAEAAPTSAVTTATAARFEGTTTERVLVRASHSLLVIVLTGFVGSAASELLKKR